jgi:polyisoprenoid-binding protein YceI
MRLLISVLLLTMTCLAQAVPLEASKGTTQFLAVGRPSAIKINGKAPGPTGELTAKKSGGDILLSGEAKVDMKALETGIGMRDRHMKEKYLEVDKYSEAILKFTDVKVAGDALKKGGVVTVPATLTLHGQSKPVLVKLDLKPKADQVVGACEFKLKLSDFAIDIPKFSGITVADEVEVNTETSVAANALAPGGT